MTPALLRTRLLQLQLVRFAGGSLSCSALGPSQQCIPIEPDSECMQQVYQAFSTMKHRRHVLNSKSARLLPKGISTPGTDHAENHSACVLDFGPALAAAQRSLHV